MIIPNSYVGTRTTNVFFRQALCSFQKARIHILTSHMYTPVLSLKNNCKKQTIIIHKRFLFSRLSNFVQKTKKALKPSLKPYATDRVHTPVPSTSSRESLNNNPAITFSRKNSSDKVIQHPEWVNDICILPECFGCHCTGLCSEYKKTISRAHFTHSNNPKNNPKYFDSYDLEDNAKSLFVVEYDEPHETSGTSYNEEKDQKYSENLKEKLELSHINEQKLKNDN